MKGGYRRKPQEEIPVISLSTNSFDKRPAKGLTATWLGQSSVLVEMNGYRILIDPVLSDHASPFPLSVRRYSKAPLSIGELPDIDVVLISHDHYDHLDKDTVRFISRNGAKFFVPLGVSNHLRKWGVQFDQIGEFSWWQKSRFEKLTIVCVPARHYSGRGIFDENKTLWSGWVVQGNTKSIYFSGDTGYANHFKQIGKELGPFDVAFIKIGEYGDTWPDTHINPEEAVQAHIDAKGEIMFPVHWATFNLAYHPWDEPIIRTVKSAKRQKLQLVTPKIGELVETDRPIKTNSWWQGVK